MERLFVLDVGNTNTSLGVYQGDCLLASWRIRTEHRVTSDELGLQFRILLSTLEPSLQVTHCILSCVVPPLLNTFVRAIETYFKVSPLVVGPGIKTGIPIRYEDPRELGADRIANAVAAVHRYQSPLIIVDLGTATTLSVIDDAGQYLGGAIAPGLMTGATALFESASRLPQVDMVWPHRLVERSTTLSMQAGILFGAVAMVDGLVHRVKRELDLPFHVVVTGGLSHLIADRLETVHHIDPHLTLEGLRLLWARNTYKPRTS
ncbi:type III pantothenate kinase [Alicyclobacillus fastidiosus]|uniref:Type III pantothenate kinase n=1 Tax=Alicyclobacillus fastidiosus TaxID=392011 RepID=A0ABY6ZH93_9BACL|nr:type III pantothenate kinase [Alicyclobacillus fastidiosus]WAH42227.1 type III pantothenate kinase [Alicyclobacillus fastidiosus]GMA64023.1 type III pantothenate kinase [Alicyclobacillus fastidiosus]